MVVSRDVTRQKQAEEALRKSEEEFRTLADNISQLAWMTNESGPIFWYNSGGMTILALRLRRCRGGAGGTFITRSIWSGSSSISALLRNRRNLGGHVPAPGKGRGLSLVSFSRSAHPRRREPDRPLVRNEYRYHHASETEQEFRRANDDLEQFAYSVSHDLQEPLRSVSIYSELLVKRYADKLDGEARDLLEYLKGGASRMETLVRDLLDYTQVIKLDVAT